MDNSLIHLALSANSNSLIVDEPGEALIRVSNVHNSVYAKSFKILVPEGLFRHRPAVSCKSDAWTLLSVAAPLGEAFRNSDHRLQIVFLPTNGDSLLIDGPIDFILTGTVGDKSGSAVISVTADVGMDASKPFSKEDYTLKYDLAEGMLFITDFFSCAPSSQETPLTQFENGSSFRLRWLTNATTIKLYGIPNPPTNYIDVSKVSWYDVPKGLIKADTTLFLVATLDIGGFTQTRYASLTVTINNPELSALTVDGQSGLAGVTMAGDLVTPGVVSAGHVKASTFELNSGVIEGDVTFRGKVVFEQPVTFSNDVYLNTENVILNSRLVFRLPNNENWYIYPAGKGLVIQGPSEDNHCQYFLDGYGGITVNNVAFIKEDDLVKIESVYATNQNRISNQYLGVNRDQEYELDANWNDLSNAKDLCTLKISIMK